VITEVGAKYSLLYNFKKDHPHKLCFVNPGKLYGDTGHVGNEGHDNGARGPNCEEKHVAGKAG
jgi:hypothetical protein